MRNIDREFSLMAAYATSENVENRSVEMLFGAMDRLWADRDLINEDSQRQRADARQRIALELDRRGVRLRDPSVEAAAVQDIRSRIGVSPCGQRYLENAAAA